MRSNAARAARVSRGLTLEYLALAAKVDPEAVAEIIQPLVSGAVLNSGLPGEKASAGYPLGDTHYAAAREKLVKIILRGSESRE